MTRTKRQHLERMAGSIMRKLALEIQVVGVHRGERPNLPFTLPALPEGCTLQDLVDVLKKGNAYEFPKADNTADAVVFGIDLEENALKVLLIERGREGEPYFGYWALPGGFINMGESLDVTAPRELLEETGVSLSYMEQLYTFSAPGRDPRGRVIATAYLGLVRPQAVTLKAADDAVNARWYAVTQLPRLGFDHRKIIRVGLRRLRSKVRWQPVGIDLLPEEFTLTQLQQVYEVVLQRELDKRTFRKKVLRFGVLIETGRTKRNGHRPAKLYRFDREAYQKLVAEGMDFEV